MSNPHKAGPGDGCMVHAGILTPHGGDPKKSVLTSGYPEAAKERFIEDMIKELSGDSPPFPCGDPNPPMNPVIMEQLKRDLPDEEKYPDFHKNILGYYQELAQGMDVPSEYNALPVGDPVAIGASLGINISIPSLGDFIPFLIPNPPLLAVKLEIPIPDIPKLPDMLLKLPLPKLPPALDIPLPELPQMGLGLPSLEIPNFLSMKLAMIEGFPDFMVDLMGKVPGFALKFITGDLPGVMGDICKLIVDSGLFGKKIPPDENGKDPDQVLMAARKVLARKMAQMCLVQAIAKTLGTAPGGLVGQLSRGFMYSPPEGDEPGGEKSPEDKARDRMVEACEKMAGTYWSDDPETYAQFLDPLAFTENSKAAVEKFKTASSCGLFGRAVLREGGARAYFDPNADPDNVVNFFKENPAGMPPPESIPSTPTGGKVGDKYIYRDIFSDIFDPSKTNPIGAMIAVAHARGAMKWAPWNNIYADRNKIKQARKKSLPTLKRGDIIIIFDLARPNRDHVIVVADDYKEGNPNLFTVEGGASDSGNKNKASYTKYKPCTGIKAKTYVMQDPYTQSAFGADPENMGPSLDGTFRMLSGRAVGYIIDSWALISGNPNPNTPQPNSDPIAAKDQYLPSKIGDTVAPGEGGHDDGQDTATAQPPPEIKNAKPGERPANWPPKPPKPPGA